MSRNVIYNGVNYGLSIVVENNGYCLIKPFCEEEQGVVFTDAPIYLDKYESVTVLHKKKD